MLKFLLLSIISAVFSILVSLGVLSTAKYSQLSVDFIYGFVILKITLTSFVLTTGTSLCNVFISKFIKSSNWSNFTTAMVLSSSSLCLFFFAMIQPDPIFPEGSSAADFMDYFKIFYMPTILLPALSWLTFKPLFIKDEN